MGSQSKRTILLSALVGALLLVQPPGSGVALAAGNSCQNDESSLVAEDYGSGFRIRGVAGLGLVAYVPNETGAELRHNWRFRPDEVVASGLATRQYGPGIFSGLENVFAWSVSVSKADLGLQRRGDYADIHIRFGDSALRQVDTCDMRVTY
jgi:hypothetical protein